MTKEAFRFGRFTHSLRGRLISVLPIVAWLSAPDLAWAGWGDDAWGELLWGDLLPEVPMLGPGGFGLLTIIAIGAGLFWSRSGVHSAYESEGSAPASAPVKNTEDEAMESRQQELLERISVLEGKLARMEARRDVVWSRIRALNPWLRTAVVTTVLAIPLAAYASSVSVPNLFVNGTVADANEVNANFASIETAVNDNDARISTVEALGGDVTDVLAGSGLAGGGSSGSLVLAVDPAQVQSRVLGTCAVGSSIRVIGVDGTVSCQTDSVGTGDITEVTAGSGLTGGGTSGAVSLSVAPSGITTGLIADGTITANDINPTTIPTFGGMTTTGATNVNGAFTVRSGNDIIIRDNFNGFRWYDDAGTTQFAALLMRDSEVSLFDANESRYVVHSDANGIGIGTTLTNTGSEVSVPSLDVSGLIDIGLERVFTNYPLASTASCHAHGNLTCYYGSGTVSCPVGKKVVGGGTTGTNSRYGGIGQSYPTSNTSWSCSASYDLANNTRNCYALCARIQ